MDMGKEKYIQVFAGETCKEKEAGLDRRIRLKKSLKIGMEMYRLD